MVTQSLDDLRYAFYGGGTDAELAALLSFYNGGYTFADVLGAARGYHDNSFAFVLRLKTANYTALSGDMVLADATAGAFTVTLPPVSANIRVVVKKIDSSANAVTVLPQSGTIDGSASMVITSPNDARTFVSDGTNWFIADDRRALPSRSIVAVTTDQAVSNSTVDTTLATLAVPTSAAAGDLFGFRILGELLNNTGSNVTYIFRVKLGATSSMVSNALSIATAVNKHNVWIEGLIYVVSATADQRLSCDLNIGLTASSSLGLGSATGTAAGRGTATENLTVGKNLLFSVQMGTADVNASFTVHEAVLTVEKR